MTWQSSVAKCILQNLHEPKTYGRNFSLLFEGRQVRAIIVPRSVMLLVLGHTQWRRRADDIRGEHNIPSAIFEATSTVSKSFTTANTVLLEQSAEVSPRSNPPALRKATCAHWTITKEFHTQKRSVEIGVPLSTKSDGKWSPLLILLPLNVTVEVTENFVTHHALCRSWTWPQRSPEYIKIQVLKNKQLKVRCAMKSLTPCRWFLARLWNFF